MRVGIIVDSKDPTKRRHSFWPDSLSDPTVVYEEVSLAESSQDLHAINYQSYDILIFNWDVANGDATFSSERTQQLLQRHQRHGHLDNFVRNGGILILEAQTSHWRPDQKSYDSVLGEGEVRVSTGREPEVSSIGVVNTALNEHPILFLLPSKIENDYPHGEEVGWFPAGSVSTQALQKTKPRKLYSGTFGRWKKE